MRISKSVINGGLVLYCLPGQILASPLGIPSSGSDVDSSSSFSISKRAALQSKTWVNGRTREEQCANSGKIPDWETAVKVYEENHIPWLIQGLIDLTNNGGMFPDSQFPHPGPRSSYSPAMDRRRGWLATKVRRGPLRARSE